MDYKPRIVRYYGQWLCSVIDPYTTYGTRTGIGTTPKEAYDACMAKRFHGFNAPPSDFERAMYQPPQEGGFFDIFFRSH